LAATAVPLVGLVWIGIRAGHSADDRNEVDAIILLSTAIAAVAIAMFLRLSRTRRELGRLGLELGASSRRLVGQLTSVMTASGVVPDQQAETSNKVFVIFGRDMQVNKNMSDFLRALGLEPLEWEHLMRAAGSPLAHINHAVATGLSAGAAQAVVALFTPDDVVMLHPHLDDDSAQPAFQARPNVLLELGRAMTTFPNQTIVVEFGRHLRPISDLDGLSVVRFDGSNTPESIGRLTARLRQAGCPVLSDGTDWLDTDRFADLDAYERRPFLPPE
jgi:predicted nucleotide-binding protein